MEEEIDRLLCVAGYDDRKVDEELLYELFVQTGPIEKVVIANNENSRTPPRRGQDTPQAYILFEHAASVPYAMAQMAGVTLFNRALNLWPRDGSIHYAKLQEIRQELLARRLAAEQSSSTRSFIQMNDARGSMNMQGYHGSPPNSASPGFNSSPMWAPPDHRGQQRIGGPYGQHGHVPHMPHQHSYPPPGPHGGHGRDRSYDRGSYERGGGGDYYRNERAPSWHHGDGGRYQNHGDQWRGQGGYSHRSQEQWRGRGNERDWRDRGDYSHRYDQRHNDGRRRNY